MAGNVLVTKLHTHFAIFLYALQLETALLTKRVHLDAADAERSVKFIKTHSLSNSFRNNSPSPGSILTFISPLKPAELQVLRSQYEKEGEHVGVQTKFNFAWVCCYLDIT
jgi:hypothetical protein